MAAKEDEDNGHRNINIAWPGRDPAPDDLDPPHGGGLTSDPGEYYDMNHASRGVAVIISNKVFGDVSWKPRKGTDEDAKKMKETLKLLGFKDKDIRRENDLSKQGMIDVLTKVSAQDFTSMDCFVCVILSYGGRGFVYGTDTTDGSVDLDVLFTPFKDQETLAGKPKLFFIQSCWPERKVRLEADAEPVDHSFQRIPREADRLCVISCIPGSLSEGWSKGKCSNNCFFIEALTKAIADHRDTLDIMTILTRMKKALAAKQSESEGSGLKALPYVTSSLTKDLFFKRK